MRILLASQVNVAQRSGAAIHQAALAREMARAGHDVRVLGRGRLDGLTPEPILPVAPEGLSRFIRRIPEIPPGHVLESKLALEVVREVQRFRPEVGYVRLSPSSSLVPAAFVATGTPYAVELNGLILEHMRLAHRGSARIAVARASLAWVIEHAAAAVAPSEAIERHLADDLHAKRVVRIENGADVGPSATCARLEARARLGLPREGALITMVGTLVPSLRLDLLFDALRALSRDTTLVIVGDGAQRGRVDAEISRGARVIFLGARPHDEAILAARAADVCVNPHDSDLSLKGLEYAAIGRRQVCFAVRGVERIRDLYAEESQAVWLVEARNGAAFAAAIEAALAIERARGELPDDEVARVRSEVAWSRTAARVLAVLDEARR